MMAKKSRRERFEENLRSKKSRIDHNHPIKDRKYEEIKICYE